MCSIVMFLAFTFLINNSPVSHVVIMKFNSSWHGVTKHYELYQLLSILWFLAVPKMLPDDIFFIHQHKQDYMWED